MKKENNVSSKQFIDLIKKTNPPKLKLSMAILMSVITTLVGLCVPLFTKNFVDKFSLSTLNAAQIALLAAVLLARAAAGGISVYLLNMVGNGIVAGIRDRLWKKLISLPIPFYDNHQTGETISRMTNDTAVIKNLASEHFTNFINGIISVVGSVIFLLILDWKLTLITLVIVPVAMLVIIPIGKQMHRISKATQDENARFTAILSKVLMEVRLVKSSNAEETEYYNGKEGIQNLLRFGIKEGKYQAMLGPVISLILMLLLVVIIGYGGMRVSSGALSAGSLVAYLLYLFQIILPMTQFAMFFTELQKAKGATERIITLLDHEEEDYASGRVLLQVDQTLHVEDLRFAYKDEEILKGVSFSVEPGKVTAIVGPSGSGKTTLFSLFERYYKPNGGEIKLGEAPIDQFTLASWRSKIGYVSQESPLIAGTIRDNICYGLDRKVSEDELQKVAMMAYADQFINDLPDGFDTEVGERGIKLSGGQRQRIGIARALLRDPQILMLDEATSSLDSKSEIVVQQALNNLMAGRTTIVIAHRLSTVVDSEQIIFLEKGEITGTGTHQELFQSHDLYREFALQQLHKQDKEAKDEVYGQDLSCG
ncbi:ABC transporter ATP-binding protein/permease [Fictibacillus sp. KIGAM418]|uniref:ABC transporter ATP-binding protein/permease n=1 Tax=Fictibacillus marinisediminis TaxID=2878389 RepID=A0A9X1XEI9_9BACL|nr:ABC transporter ATP-binding protein [Fictibacillus marinisediminis]MCK6256214.1 ABC transporter ATP-binding protein/permease [Fictibacillus marinisediminis]